MLKPILSLTFSTLLLGAPLADAAILYRNNFGNNTGERIALNHANIGWKVFRSAEADLNRAMDYSGTTGNTVAISAADGVPDTTGNTNAPSSLSATLGYAFLTTNATENRKAIFYTEYTISRSDYRVDAFEWDAVVSRAGRTQRLALRIGSDWFVSEELQPVISSTFATAGGSTLLSQTLESTSWYQLTFVASQPFAISNTATVLPSDDITAFGLFIELGTGDSVTSGFDNFTIHATAIPEGSSVTLALSAGGIALALRRLKAGGSR